MNTGHFPNSWCEGLISPIFKSGNKLDPNNYRGICVSSSLGKLFCSILNNRLLTFLETKQLLHPSQIGFIPGNRTADHILTLKTLHEKYVNQKNEKIYTCFVDFKKAFDSIWHEGLYLKLLENKIGGRFYDLIKDLYSNTKCAVKISDNRTPFFSYNRGVRQGCVLSPILFNIFIDELPKLFEKTNSDPFLLPNGTKLSSLLYADDLVILSRSKNGLQNCLNILNEWSKKWMMNVNLKKNKIMIMQKHNSKTKKSEFFLGDKNIDMTNEILLYNSEIWGAYVNKGFMKWDNTPTEKAHLKFCKLYLGVNRKASNIASRGELGKFPLLIPIFKRLFTYINHITKLYQNQI